MIRIKDIDKLYPSKKAALIKYKLSLMSKADENKIAFYKKNEKQIEHTKAQFNKSRRKFLDMVAKAGIAPYLLKSSALISGIMANRYALAADGIENKRVVYCYLNSGAQNTTWLPSSATNMNIVTQPYGPSGYNVASICHFRQVNVMQEGHSNATQALGVPGYGIPTMDARIAPIIGATTPYSSVYLGSQATTSGVLCSTIGPCNDSPASAYKRLFQTAPPTGEQDNTYTSVFESNQKALTAIKSKLSLEEKERLETHAAALKKIEDRITAARQAGGPDLSACDPGVPTNQENIQSRGKAQADIIVAALQCGLTRLATLQLGNHQGDWYGHNTQYKGDAHNSCHSSGPETNDEIVRYLSDVPAYLLRKLMDTNGPDGQKLIDTTVFAQVTCMGNGRDHSRQNGPFMMATRMPGFAQGFSAASQGTTEDFNGAIPRGLGIADSAYDTMGSNNLGLI